ncbi:MAG: ATP-binding protein, partial [Actinomycetota bacterium]|nr:ATP-binding protein [Actinomycetota bacterium]
MDTLATKRGRVDAARDDRVRLAALNELCAALYEYDSNEAVKVADEALMLAKAIGDGLGQAWALHNRGWAYSSLGRLDEALDDQLSARAHFELEGNMQGVGNALMAIGDLYGDVGDNATALEYLERAAAPLKLVNDELGMGLLTNLTGIALSHEGRHKEALDIFEQAEAAYRSLGDQLRIGTTLINQGFELLVIAKDAEGAEREALISRVGELVVAIVARGERLGEDGRHTLAYGKSLAAQLHAAAGRRAEALVSSAEAENAANIGGLDQLSVEIALDRAGWLIEDCQLYEAGFALDQIVTKSEKIDMKRAAARATELRADLFEALGDHAAALAAYREFHRLDGALHTDEAEKRSRMVATRFQVERARRETELAQVRVSELEALDHEKRDFLASISHELRTPLAAVLGFATELADSWDGFEPAEARSLVRLIASQSADISSIVDDLLTVTRLEAGTMSVFPTDVDVTKHLADMAESAGRDASRKIAWEGDITVWADPTRLTQIVRNLVTNAIRYGGNEIRVVVSRSASTGVIEVRDSGGPIPASR